MKTSAIHRQKRALFFRLESSTANKPCTDLQQPGSTIVRTHRQNDWFLVGAMHDVADSRTVPKGAKMTNQ